MDQSKKRGLRKNIQVQGAALEKVRIGGGERREKVRGDEDGQALAGGEKESRSLYRAAAQLQYASPTGPSAPCGLHGEIHPLPASLDSMCVFNILHVYNNKKKNLLACN